MAVFLDTSQKRKYIFRLLVIGSLAFIFLGLVFTFLGLAHIASSTKSVSYAEAAERYHYYNSPANNKKVAITIDDGPHEGIGSDMMDILEAKDAPATFFYIGIRALGRPDILKQASERGFDVEAHSFTHSHKVDASHLRMAMELYSTDFFLRSITGNRPIFYRPPFLLGVGTDATLNPYTPFADDVLWSLELGYVPVGADLDPKDWLATSSQVVVSNLKNAIKEVPNGHMVLLHEDRDTLKALPEVIDYLRSEGYSIVPLRELLTPPTNIVLNTTLAKGDTDVETGGDVSRLQWFLYKNNFLDSYALTGIFDQDTHDALLAFQQKVKIVGSDVASSSLALAGVLDGPTRARLNLNSISTSSLASVGASFGPASVINTGHHFLASGIKWLYIKIIPNVLLLCSYAVKFTLVLVMFRLSFLLGLLLWRYYKGPSYGVWSNSTLKPSDIGVSVLIPGWNEEENIAATVESVVRSSYPKREIIVIDDGSTDNTASEVRAVMKRFPDEPIRLLELENGGKARALNMGLEVASYEIVIVLDADAIISTDAISMFVRHFEDSRVVAVAGKVCTAKSRGLMDTLQTLEYAVGQNIDKKAYGTIGAVGVVPGPAGAWRKDLLIQKGGFRHDTLVEDQEMTLALLNDGGKIIYEPLAVSYTETPHTLRNFLKQRFRWVYGTIQCFWKYKGAVVKKPFSSMSLVVLPNIAVYNIMLPLTYPIADSALLIGIMLGQWQNIVYPFLLFTVFDICYALIGSWGEMHPLKAIVAVPIQRVVYRWLLYYTVLRGVVAAVEGTGQGWNKFKKVGDTKKYFLTDKEGQEVSSAHVASMLGYQLVPEVVTTSFQGPAGTSTSSINAHDTLALSDIPRHLNSAGDTSNPALSPKVLTGLLADPNTNAKSSSPLGPTSSH